MLVAAQHSHGRNRIPITPSSDTSSSPSKSHHFSSFATFSSRQWPLKTRLTSHIASQFYSHVGSCANLPAPPLTNIPSDTYPEILMPVPLRHRALQPSPDTWIRTPSPSSSRAISPTSPLAGVFPRGHHSYSSFGAIMETEETLLQEQGLGRRWLRWMHKNGLKHWVVPCTLLAAAVVRWCVGLGPYSGK